MQTVPTQFNTLAQADVRPNAWGIRISFDKAYDDDVTLFTLDQSQLDGPDLLATSEDNPLQAWDFYLYADYSDRIVQMSWQRELDFPFSVVSARADFELANTDDYFTPNGGSPIEEYILPKRPVRLLSGFSNMLLPQFVGLTQGMPEIGQNPKTAIFTALDFLTMIYEMPIRNTIAMQDVRTDEVLGNIFAQFGLAPEQYDLARARNKIPFLFFERDQITAGEVIRQLMQAEMGMLWLSETGIIIFRPRLEQPNDAVYYFDESSIVDLSVSRDDQIINQVNFLGDLREVQEYQVVYLKSEGGQLDVVPANSTYVFSAELTDPCLSIEEPTPGENSSVSWFKAVLPNGDEVTSDITVTAVELRTNSYEITFTNDNGFPVDISEMQLWGQPAKIFDRVNRTLWYPPSVTKYETKPITIENNFIQSEDQMQSLGLTILDEYAEYASILTLEVKGNPALQLGDVVEVDYRQFDGQYRIIAINNSLRGSKFTQELTLRTYTPREWFTLNQSVLDGTDVIAP
jgi:hypothetical protein